MNGILNIDKPWGATSFSVVAIVRRLSGERRVGHAGTLDPAATGVLPVCLGQGTRVIEFLTDASKSYRAEIELGVATDTYDASGQITLKRDPSGISRGNLEAALISFRGLIQQIPPMYSALKHHGQPLYKLARAGIEVERKSRPTRIYRLEIIDWQPPVVTVEVDCEKGTYIRSLAHDLGQSMGCGATLKNLIRLRCGLFTIEDAVSVPQLEEAFRYGYWQHFVHPIDTVLSHWRTMIVNDETENIIRKGSSFTLEGNSIRSGDNPKQPLTGSSVENYCRAYSLDGRFLGILLFNHESGQWHPEKVFLEA